MLERLTGLVAKLATSARRRPAARAAQFPALRGYGDLPLFKFKVPLLVLEEIVELASVSALSRTGCSICLFHQEFTGNDGGLGSDDGPSEISFLGGG
eukprot:885898-Pyramimonas_sp.AAC.1